MYTTISMFEIDRTWPKISQTFCCQMRWNNEICRILKISWSFISSTYSNKIYQKIFQKIDATIHRIRIEDFKKRKQFKIYRKIYSPLTVGLQWGGVQDPPGLTWYKLATSWSVKLTFLRSRSLMSTLESVFKSMEHVGSSPKNCFCFRDAAYFLQASNRST